jgi:hypothetical protein
VYVDRLLAVFGSGVVETTVAVLSNGPDELGPTTTSVIVAELAEPLEGIVPREQVTVPMLEEQGDVAETNVMPAGKMSVTVTPAAALGPAFLTTMVYVMFVFAATVGGIGPLSTIETSAWSAGAVTAMVQLALTLPDAESVTLTPKI